MAEVIARAIAGPLVEEAAVGPGEDVGAPDRSPATGGIVTPRPHDEVSPPIPIHVPRDGTGYLSSALNSEVNVITSPWISPRSWGVRRNSIPASGATGGSPGTINVAWSAEEGSAV